MKLYKSILAIILALLTLLSTTVCAFAVFPKYEGNTSSLVDALAAVGCSDTSFGNRSRIAAANGISDYVGSADQNLLLLTLLRNGILQDVSDSNASEKANASTLKQSKPQYARMYKCVVNSSIDCGFTVIKDDSPLRDKPSRKGKVITRIPKGTVIGVAGSLVNNVGNIWYAVPVEEQTCYIFAGNVEEHKHVFEEIEYGNVTFYACNCGKVIAKSKDEKAITRVLHASSTLALPSLGLAMVDGPLPFGDFVAASLVLIGMCYELGLSAPDTDTISSVITETDFLDYLEKTDNQCTPYTFRRVQRIGGKLKYLDDKCLNMVEAYLYVRFLNGDVYTEHEDAALLLVAQMHGSGIMERDKCEYTYFYHYHLGTDRLYKGHIFFGVNDFNERPI